MVNHETVQKADPLLEAYYKAQVLRAAYLNAHLQIPQSTKEWIQEQETSYTKNKLKTDGVVTQ